MPRVSCVICAHNEAPRIGVVLKALEDHPHIDEIIVVDDGSTDETADIIRAHPHVTLISYPENRGKSYALSQGLRAARGEHLLLLDADLAGIEAQDVTALIFPLLRGDVPVTMSVRKNSLLPYRLIGLDFITGERALPRTLLEGHLDTSETQPRYGVEVFMNNLIVQQGFAVRVVKLHRVINVTKGTKTTFLQGLLGDLRMTRDMLGVHSARALLRQNMQLLSLMRPFSPQARINREYLQLYKELVELYRLSLSRASTSICESAALVVAPCLIGEFAVSIPALRDFIGRNPEVRVDLAVSPSVVPLAQHIRGVGRVFPVSSIYGRESITNPDMEVSYESVHVLRGSVQVRRLLAALPRKNMSSSARSLSAYALHLWYSVLRRTTPLQWREFNFKLLGGVSREIPFENMFDFSPAERARVKKLIPFSSSRKKVLVHMSTRWSMKRWPAERWALLLEKLNRLGKFDFIFVGAPEDEKDFLEIAPHLSFSPHSMIGQLNTAELLLLMRHCDYFIGVDSGPANLAHLAELPAVVLFGPGPHMYLPPKGSIALDKSKGRGLLQMFVHRENNFIKQISVEEVVEALKKLSASNLHL